ncbi:low-affinity phosphate transporter [Malassezia yamatoensis]|uniref:Low-affinity phosphate transporter n=1 Tax=Malassezia yamatoensis TaxID=253288 RepID=A0AAJ6CFU5_9BASI|nr:low-affinity phosphate transporter [Malassezia yamatoensis]
MKFANESYQHLKKIIYSFERAQYNANDADTSANRLENESQVLLSSQPSDTDAQFVPHLDKELRKIVDFYSLKEKELSDDVHIAHEHVRLAEEEFQTNSSDDSDADYSDDADEATDSPVTRRKLPAWYTPRRRRSIVGQGDVETQSGTDLSPTASNTLLPAYKGWIKTFGRRSSFRRPRRNSSADRYREANSSGMQSIIGGVSTVDDGNKSVWQSHDEFAIDVRITLKRELTALHTSLCELQKFTELNLTGMVKILKKYDKVTGSQLKSRYVDRVVKSKYPFQTQAHARLEENLNEVTHLYATVATRGDVEQAQTQLKAQLREEVVWQRNTVWREMINIERRAQAASLEGDGISPAAADLLAKETRPPRVLNTPWGEVKLPPFLTIGTIQLVSSVLLFVLLLKNPLFQVFEQVEVQNCFALLVFCTCLWVTEVIPLFVTSFLVPLLIVTLRVAREEHDGVMVRKSASDTSKWVFQQMFSSSVLLLLGGFTLAAALSKYGIDKILATRVLRMAGTRPSVVLLAHMLVACFASMWISNVAAPVLMFSLVQPILRNLPPKSPYATSLVMGIALASNIGGQTSPIASPQNLIALEYMKQPLGWLQWFSITIPVSGISLLVLWALLLWSFGSGKGVVIKKIPEPNDSLDKTQWFISAVCIGTIILWCIERKIEWIVGDMAVIAIIPLVCFFGIGILTKEDFNNFLWTIVFLAMGGIALGKGVDSSGLLSALDHFVQSNVEGLPLYRVLLLLVGSALVVATFISHTIAAVLLVPLAAQIGESLTEPHSRLLIMATVLTASAAMGLPISGFPNMTAINLEDEVGHRYVTVKTFLRVGIPASILSTLVISTLGYAIMTLLDL